MNVIEVKDLKKTFRIKIKKEGLKGSIKSIFKPEYKEVDAVNGITFNVEKGEILAFLGPNGAEKSTTTTMGTGTIVSFLSTKVTVPFIFFISNQHLLTCFYPKFHEHYLFHPLHNHRLN